MTPDNSKPGNIILLKKAPKSSKNLFLIHEGTGRIESYFRVSQHLHPGFNIYGVCPVESNKCKDHLEPEQISIPRMAGTYRQTVEQFIGKLPVYVAGWSLGGSIAHEMAYQWQKEKKTVRFLGLLDVIPPGSQVDDVEFNLKTELGLVVPYISNEGLIAKLSEATSITSIWNIIQRELSHEDFDREAFMKSDVDWVNIIPNYNQLTIQDFFLIVNQVRGYYRALVEYEPEGSVDCTVHYFQASDSVITNVDAWKPYSSCLACHQVPGEHYTMLNQQNILEFAQIFNQVLDSFR